MARVQASAERTVDAPADEVYGYLADMHRHPHFLPSAFSGFQVVEGGVGAGTVTTFAVTAGGIGGFFEKAFAPGAMRRLYLDELDRLNTYATQQQSS